MLNSLTNGFFTMKKILSLTLLGSTALLILGGCSSLKTTVIPQGNHSYQLIATSDSSADSQQGAIKKASEICQSQGKRLVVTKNKTIYQGANKELGVITDTISKASFMNGGASLPSTKTATDYKTTVSFKCK